MPFSFNENRFQLEWVSIHGRALTLGAAHVAQSDDVRVLGVQLSSDLSLDKHVNVVSAKCFFKLRRIRRSLDDDSVATLVHAFITSRVDYCNSLVIGAPKKTTDKLQRVLNSGISGRRHLRSADCGHLDFPHVKLASYGGRSFAYAGPSDWNSLPAHLLFHLLSATSKPFSSLSTRLAHTARLGFFLQKRAI